MNASNLSLRTPSHYFEVYIYSLVSINATASVVATVLNSVFIYAFVKTPSLRTCPAFILMLSLSVTDLAIGIAIQPAYYVLLLTLLNFPLPKNLLFMIMQNGGVPLAFASIMTIFLMAVDRYLAVKFVEYKSLVTSKRASKAVIATMLSATAFSGLTMVEKIKRFIAMGAITLVSLSVIVGFVLMICTSYSINLQIKRVKDLKGGDKSTAHIWQYQRSIKTLYYIIVPFVICYFPLFVVKILDISRIYENTDILTNAALTLCLLNSAINPCIYISRIHDIRKAVLSIVRPC